MAVMVSPVIEDASLDAALSQLQIPPEFKNYDDLTETATIVKLEEWRRRTYTVLKDFQARLADRRELSVEKQANVVCAITPLCEEHAWTMGSTRELATGM